MGNIECCANRNKGDKSDSPKQVSKGELFDQILAKSNDSSEKEVLESLRENIQDCVDLSDQDEDQLVFHKAASSPDPKDKRFEDLMTREDTKSTKLISKLKEKNQKVSSDKRIKALKRNKNRKNTITSYSRTSSVNEEVESCAIIQKLRQRRNSIHIQTKGLSKFIRSSKCLQDCEATRIEGESGCSSPKASKNHHFVPQAKRLLVLQKSNDCDSYQISSNSGSFSIE